MTRHFDVAQKFKLDNPKRRAALPPEQTLRTLGLTEGAVMADIGCGIGYFSIPASAIVGPEGKVYALDISEEMLDEVRTAVIQGQLSNLEPVRVHDYNLKLESASINYAFCCNVLHEIDELDRYLQEIKRLLTPGGHFVVVEWEKIQGEWGPPADDRLDKERLSDLLKDQGFEEPIQVLTLGHDFYAIIAGQR